MPPKTSSRPHAARPSPASLSTLPLWGSSNAALPREPFSIASVFDAASARRGSGSGGGHRVGASSHAPLPAPSSSPPASRAYPSRAHATEGTRAPQHWSASTTAVHPDAADHGSNGGDVASHRHPQPGATADGVSSTLQGVRRRIMSDLEASRDGSRESAGRLHAHRQRALRVAFGESSAPRRRGSRGLRTSTADGGASPGDARQSRSQQTPNTEDAEDDELMVASVEFSLLCPYSRLPMRCLVRSRECSHLQCCDVDSWVVMLDKCRSMRDPVGPCPVCERRVASSSLEVDLWMMNVKDQMPAGTQMVVLEPDGTFRSGDTCREQRKERIMMEVVDATQGDYENYLGEVVDSDEDVVAHEPGAIPWGATASASPVFASAGVCRPRTTSPTAATPPLVRVKTETGGLSAAGEPSLSDSVSQEDGGVVVVRFVEGRHDGLQALPSQIRNWVPHCTQCGAPRVKAEDGRVEGCQQCGYNAKDDWNLVRRFEETPAVSMELIPDGTLVLHGVDLLAPYLFRAGFYRSLFEVMEFTSLAERQRQQYRPPVGVWTSSFPLSRFEIDFLEACCARVAKGESLDAIDALLVPSLFRIPRQRRPGAGGAGRASFLPSSSGASSGGGTVAVGHRGVYSG
ncbi:MIZ/SP-RING zinc finger containing protein [Novymonas esmeraldas]|uniref:MIZ/SP-RING zinc finger containing protein n=1 Tax=Novymonas esmeraldas TaxID=1808958 RepID=A0AAW0EY21_9TRYP